MERTLHSSSGGDWSAVQHLTDDSSLPDLTLSRIKVSKLRKIAVAWIDRIMQRECLPVLEAGMGFAHQKALIVANNIANVETPEYRRTAVPEDQFYGALRDAISEREEYRTGGLDIQEQFDVRFNGSYPKMRMLDGKEYGPERHDENSVTIEHEMAEQAKNTLKMQAMQQLYKKHLTMMRAALRDRVS